MAKIIETRENTVTAKQAEKGKVKITKIDVSKPATGNVTAAAKSVVIYKADEMKALSLADADKNIKAIRATGTKLRRLAHTTAIGILMHWQEHGDWTKLVDLRNAIADTMSKRMADGFTDWIKAFSSLEYNKDSGKFQSSKGAAKGERMFNLTGNHEAEEDTLARKGALNQPFYDGSFGDAPEHKFDFETAFKQFYARVQRELKRKEAAVEAKHKREAKLIDVEADHLTKLENLAKGLNIVLVDETEAKAA